LGCNSDNSFHRLRFKGTITLTEGQDCGAAVLPRRDVSKQREAVIQFK